MHEIQPWIRQVGVCGTPGTASETVRTGEDQSKVMAALDVADNMGSKHKAREGPVDTLLPGHHVHGRGAKKPKVVRSLLLSVSCC